MKRGVRSAVIGAGPSGLTAAKNLLQGGVTDLVVFEKSDQVGGNWVFRPDPSHSSVYETTHIISSKSLSSYEDFPMPAEYPDYPSHSQLRVYFERYARHFGVLPYVRFDTEVLEARLSSEDVWQLRVRSPAGEQVEHFDWLFVCNGHHWDPRMPRYPGTFGGEFLHSHDSKRAAPFAGQRVLVIGGGNSAADIAVETSRVAEHVAISMQRGYWIVPKFLFGLPSDVPYVKLSWLPGWLRQKVMKLVLLVVQGRNARYGLQEPESDPLEHHPTINSELLYFIRHGEIEPRVGVSRFDGTTVHFNDGTSEDFDVVVAATGYRMSFPFFDPSFVDYRDATTIPLYRKMFHPQHENLFFIGLFQPLGCIWPLADHQARLAVKFMQGKWRRPANMQAAIRHELAHPHFRFQPRPRHAAEVDYAIFRKELLRELARAT
jgi:cation diffusion facilitator CzcD-associated flavoprotein CzcO